MRPPALLLVFALAACGGSGASDGESGTDEGGCDPDCEAVIHFVGNVGIPVGIDQFSFAMCADECIELELSVPATELMQSAGDDPSVSVAVTRTNEDYYQDLQGVFAFEGTWTSGVERLETGDLVRVLITRLEGGNIASTLRSLDPEEADGACGCPTVEMEL